MKHTHPINCPVFVDMYNYKTKEVDKIEGIILGTVSALDRDYRVNVRLNDGREISQAAPECVHLINNI